MVANVRVSLRVENTKSAFSVDASSMVLVITTYSGHDEVSLWPKARSARLANRSEKVNIEALPESPLVSEEWMYDAGSKKAGYEGVLILHMHAA